MTQPEGRCVGPDEQAQLESDFPVPTGPRTVGSVLGAVIKDLSFEKLGSVEIKMSFSSQSESRQPNTNYPEHVSLFVNILKGKWTIQILYAMCDHPVRLSELKRIIPSASKKALVANLRLLEDQRLVLRRDLSGSVLHVEYELMETMHGPMMTILNYIAKWGEVYESHLKDDTRRPKQNATVNCRGKVPRL